MKTFLISLAVCISIPVFSQTGWTWQNPLPQGNLIHEIQYIDKTRGWAVGHFGTILYTENLGNNWKIYDSPTENHLYDLFMLSSDKGWAVGQNGTILHWNGIRWSGQNSGFEGLLYGVHFVNSNTGWAVGQGEVVLKTTNGGADWTRTTFEGSQHYFGVYFLDEKKGYLCGAAGSNGVIKYSSDGGSTWKTDIIPAHRMNDITMVNAGSGWAVGDEGAIFHKEHIDSTWKVLKADSSIDFQSVSAINPNQAWIAGTRGTIFHTNDAGKSWIRQTPPDERDLYSIFILDGETGFAAGDAGALFHTWNAGGSWEIMGRYGPNGRLTGISFMYPELGMVCGVNGEVYSTLDLGETWTYDSTYNSKALFAIDISRHYLWYDRALAVGSSGTILRRFWDLDLLDSAWTKQVFNQNEDLFSVQVRGRTAFAVGHWATVARTLNSGKSWDVVHHSNKYHLYGIHFPSTNYGWAVGMASKILHTQDKGETWEEQISPVSTNFNAVCFCDIYSGWAVGLSGNIIHTKDGGKTWEKQNSFTGKQLKDVHFTDCNNGWIVGDFGTILHTSNGGINWGKQESGTSNFLWSVDFADPLHGWICGDNGTVLYTADGGGSTKYEILSRSEIGKTIMDLVETMDTIEFENSQTKSGAEMDKLTFIEVIIDSISHPNLSDLEITLSHAGITDTLVYRNAEGENFIDLKLTDAGEMPLDSGLAPYSGSFSPWHSLSAFVDTDPEGPWILHIYDAATDNTGSLEGWSLALYFSESDVGSSVESLNGTVSRGIILEQNYPNPFYNQTYIRYHLPQNAEVEIDIYNFLGQHIATLLKEKQIAGDYQTQWDATGFTSGVYFLQLRVDHTIQTRKMVLMK